MGAGYGSVRNHGTGSKPHGALGTWSRLGAVASPAAKGARQRRTDPLAGTANAGIAMLDQGRVLSSQQPTRVAESSDAASNQRGSSASRSSGSSVDRLLLDVGAVAAMLSVSIPTVWRLRRQDPAFPQPRTIPGRRATRWVRSEIVAYAANLPVAQ